MVGVLYFKINGIDVVNIFTTRVLIDWGLTPTLAVFHIYRNINKFYKLISKHTWNYLVKGHHLYTGT